MNFNMCGKSERCQRFSLKVLTSKIVNLGALAASLTKFPGCYGDHPDSSTGLIRALTPPITD